MTLLDALHPSIEHDSVEGADAVTLAAGALEATFVPQVGMLVTSLRHAGEELLDRHGGLHAYRHTGALMGVPLLHPWANRLARDELVLHGHRVRLSGMPLVRRDANGLPIHGLLGAHPGWAVHALDADGHAARLVAEFDFAADARLTAAFPFPHALVIEAALTAHELRVATTVRATAGVPVPIAFGYHPYVRIPGRDRRGWEVRLPPRRHLRLDALGLPTGRRRAEDSTTFLLSGAAFDDAYDRIEDGAAFSVSAAGLELTVTHEGGFPAAQIFSPAGAEFICFEPMTAPTNALSSGDGLRFVGPGDSFTATFSISVRRATTC